MARPRARIAALTRSRQPDDPDLIEARAELRVAMLTEAVQRAVDAAPPLSHEQRSRLARLLQLDEPHGVAS